MLFTLLETFANDYGFIFKEEIDLEKHFVLKIDPTTSLKIREIPKGFSLESTLCLVPKDLQEELLILLMKANFLGQGTDRGMLAISQNGLDFLYRKNVQESLSRGELKEHIEQFVNYLNYWKSRINEEIRKKAS